MKNIVVVLLAVIIVLFLYTTISQFKLLLLTNMVYGALFFGLPVGFVLGYRYAKKRHTSSTTRL